MFSTPYLPRIQKRLLSTIIIIVSLLSFMSGSMPFAYAQGVDVAAPLLNPHLSYKPVCPKDNTPGMARCNAEVVTDIGDNPLVSPNLTAGYGPADFRGAYGLSGISSTNRTVAIVDAYDDPTVLDDLDMYSTTAGIPTLNRCAVSTGTAAHPCIQKVDQNGGTTYPAYNAGWSEEIALDVESVHALCQNCNILLVEATTNSNYNLIVAADRRAFLMGANVISNSWGGSEFYGETSYDSYFNHPGVAFVFSTGDYSYSYGTQYPSVSPFVTAVGGTALYVNSNHTYNHETAWSGTVHAASSGCSLYEAKPTFQHDADCPHNRTVADVSADADPSTGAAVYLNGLWYQIGGTSLAAPLVAAVYAMAGGVGTTRGNSLLYANHKYGANLRDVIGGSTGSCGGSYLCTAKTGYDGPTGLGTPKGYWAFAKPPVVPLNVKASDGIYKTKVLVTWNASGGATSYKVYRATTAAGPKSLRGSPTVTSFNDTTATHGVTYYYWVRAYRGTNYSGYSAYNTGWRKLSPPNNVQASDGTYTTRVLVTWNASSGATSYKVYRATTAAGTKSLRGSPTITSFNDTTATPGVTYYYWVVAYRGTRHSNFSAYNTGWRHH